MSHELQPARHARGSKILRRTYAKARTEMRETKRQILGYEYALPSTVLLLGRTVHDR